MNEQEDPRWLQPVFASNWTKSARDLDAATASR